MDEGTRSQIIALAARIGMILEDASATAVLIGDFEDLLPPLATLANAIGEAGQIVASALILAERPR